MLQWCFKRLLAETNWDIEDKASLEESIFLFVEWGKKAYVGDSLVALKLIILILVCMNAMNEENWFYVLIWWYILVCSYACDVKLKML